MVKVILLEHTPEPERLVAAAARLCYSPKGAAELLEDFTPEKVEGFVRKLVSLGHESPMEHVCFTFGIEGISRACSHQLVRHRIGASYSQKSQRYVREKQFDYVLPPTIEASPELTGKFKATMARLQGVYEELLAAGIPAEDARFVLPNAASTSLVLTMNVRSLWHFFELRCCQRAQWEIRNLAYEMRRLVRGVAPLLFAKAGPTCESLGLCFEGSMSCGRCPNVVER